MYRHQWGALAPTGRPAARAATASSLCPSPRYPFRPPTYTPYRPDTGPRPSYTRPRSYRSRPPTTSGPSRPSPGPLRSGTGAYRAGHGHPYARHGDTARPPCPAMTSGTRTGPPPHPLGSRRQSSGKNSCQICSFSQKAPETKQQVYHDHFSSKHLRELLDVEFSLSGSYYCPSCKCNHAPYPSERTKIVLSDSTMHNFFAPPSATNTNYEGDVQHTDYLTISGATLETLFHAFKIEYSYHTKPMDVVIIAGVIDIVKTK